MNKRQNSDGDPGPSQPKRLRTLNTDPASGRLLSADHHGPSTAQLSHDDYTIAWICALPLELKASRAMFDELNPSLPTQQGDNNSYILGRIKQHNVVMACLPGQYGTNNAAIVATDLHRSFRKIRATLLVGIGGGAPSETYDIRLGDVVVGTRVMQYDMGKNVGEGKFQRTCIPKIPPRLLLGAVSTIRSDPTLESRLADLVQTKLTCCVRPPQVDQLFLASYEHADDQPTCDGCDLVRLEQRRERGPGELKVHYGGIASADTVMKNARARDELARELSVLCFEMEAAGIMDNQCMPIRGICDYADSHKNKAWQDYAAAVAAVYARELLGALSPTLREPASVQTGQMARELGAPDVRQLSTQREQLLKSLDFPRLNSRVTTIQRAHARTCRWFLTHSKYKNWLDPRKQQQNRGFLWILGKAGAGKSTIMKFAYLETKKGSTAPGNTIASFFFNARGEFLERSIAGMYRSLLLQLLNTYTDLQNVLNDPDIVPEDQTDCPDLNVLKDLFRSAIMLLKQRSFTCFADALDECDEQEVQDMVEFFRELAEETTKAGIQFRVCFSSRPYPYIYTGAEVLLVLEKEAGHADDLSQYVASRLKIKNPLRLSELKVQILEKASGVFMWVVLVVAMLNRETNNGALAMERKLATIPEKLSDLFKSILTRDERDTNRLLLSVLWVLCARRPLSPLEFRHAVWAGELAQGEVDDVLKDNSLETAINLVTSSSKGLAEITTSEQPIVQFIHESVRDYLIRDNGLREIWPNLGIEWEPCAHEKLKNCCDTYLSLKEVQSILESFEAEDWYTRETTTAESYPFLGYACRRILYHADAAAAAIPQDDFVDRFLAPTGIRALNHTMTDRNRRYTLQAPPLYVLAHQGLATLVRMQVRRTPATHTEEFYNQPLFAALACNHPSAAKALLGSPSIVCDGFDITDGIRGRVGMNSKTRFSGRTPLSWAAQEGILNLTEALIQAGADVNECDKNGNTALKLALQSRHAHVGWLLIDNGADYFRSCWVQHSFIPGFFSKIDRPARAQFLLDREAMPMGQWRRATVLINAIASGSETAVRLVIQQGADVDATAFGGITALTSALRSRRQAMAKLLIALGVDVVACGRYEGRTMLMHALTAGFEDVAQDLIIGGVSVNDEDIIGRTALNYALEKESEAVVRLLVENGADVNHPDKDGKTVLMHVSTTGNEADARLLIDNGANVNHLDKDGRTVLMHASTTGNEAVARLLIDHDAQVDRRDHDGRTALMMVSAVGWESFVRMLIKKAGANVDASNSEGRTALMEAIHNRHQGTARILIEEGGADVNARDMKQSTALLQAARDGRESMVQLLTEKGADIEARDESGWTALMWAAAAAAAPVRRWSSPSVARLLIQKGARVESRDQFGLTALMRACAVGNSDTASILLDEGRADINARDTRGWTALMMAANAGKQSVVEILLAKQADRLVRDDSGWTALSLATSRGYSEVARLLEL